MHSCCSGDVTDTNSAKKRYEPETTLCPSVLSSLSLSHDAEKYQCIMRQTSIQIVVLNQRATGELIRRCPIPGMQRRDIPEAKCNRTIN